MKGGEFFRLKPFDLIEIHPDSEIFLLPCRAPVGYDPSAGKYVKINEKGYLAVSAFPAPGRTTTYSASYSERGRVRILPLFSYAAVAFYRGKFYVAATCVDRERRQSLKGMDISLVEKGVKDLRKVFPKNRLVRHLEGCALNYGCPAAKNFFLKRYEGPLPTSPSCNAVCLGCISKQPRKSCSVTQPRITFIPTAEEIAEVALFHIKNVADPVVSFGQGCEGEPLMVGKVLVEAVRMIRKSTSKGMVNLNTNASKPEVIRELFDAGLDSIRVSTNSLREKYYNVYYKPRGYTFSDVKKSIRYAKKANGFVSLNYLVMPGFTDLLKETEALEKFIEKNKVDMIQWRNLNYDPKKYFKKIKYTPKSERIVGVKELIEIIGKKYPRVMCGYFNPSKLRIKRFRSK
ncbi:radical SAM protein [Candidatus Omnitrophota bacterium]